MDFPVQIILITYLMACLLLMLFGLNCHVMIHFFKRRLKGRRAEDKKLLDKFYAQECDHPFPFVTVQAPIFNELNVAERIIDAVAAFDYPPGKLEIQVLDDSTDETRHIVAEKIRNLEYEGIAIEHVTRPDRKGFKAGALRYGIKRAKGELVAIFDADFTPPRDFFATSRRESWSQRDAG